MPRKNKDLEKRAEIFALKRCPVCDKKVDSMEQHIAENRECGIRIGQGLEAIMRVIVDTLFRG